MFPKINPLPGPQGEASASDRDAEVHGGQGRPHVRRHVVVALEGVLKQRVAVWNEPREKPFEIAPHLWVGIFLDEQRGRGMPQVKREQAGGETALRHPGCDFPGEFVEPASPRGNRQFVQRLF